MHPFVEKSTKLYIKDLIEVEALFDTQPDRKLECILVEGAPGVGKTTMAWQVCHQWALFQEYSLVFLLWLRIKTVQRATTLKDFIMPHAGCGGGGGETPH